MILFTSLEYHIYSKKALSEDMIHTSCIYCLFTTILKIVYSPEGVLSIKKDT